APCLAGDQFDTSIIVSHKPVLEDSLKPPALCRLSGRNGGRFRYVADPMYGFAYVRNSSGDRLDTKGLIAAFKENPGDLVFGVIVDGVVREVSGNDVRSGQPTFGALYYTTDKRIEYR
ncbi:MAG: hypothetical protein AB7I79_03435, partial [Rhizobiaceae bacterium]